MRAGSELPSFTVLSPAQRQQALATARSLVRVARERSEQRSPLDAFLQEFGLSNPEGVALMCLAESLLRIPDDDTADRLIAEKLAEGEWSRHAGRSGSLFVNASTWALMLTGRLVDLPDGVTASPGGWLRGLARRAGEPVVRAALRRAVQIIGGEFVAGRDISEALARSAREDSLALCSFDMLGEGARTASQAQQYFDRYVGAIEAIAKALAPRQVCADPAAVSSISIKLSALHPRFQMIQRERVHEQLLPRARELARLAARHGLGLTVDAEEMDRLEITLEVVQALARDATTRDWPGLGLAVQAYGTRAAPTLDFIVALARDTGRRMSVRLVKGAYWDTEIKRAQERGLAAYPVYTRKAATDLSYLSCARRLLDAGPSLYAQFATHNAYTIAAVLAMRPSAKGFEFQRLHGMGELLYDTARRELPALPPVRVYAPVGAHEDLLAYLVRRLLENGANTSFVNRFLDEQVPVETVVADPAQEIAGLERIDHPALPLPRDLYGRWRNSSGVDFGLAATVMQLEAAVRGVEDPPGFAGGGEAVDIINPADRRETIGHLRLAGPRDVDAAFARAEMAQPGWNALGGAARAAILERAAEALEASRDRLLALLVREGGRTLPDAVSEVREAADFCRYYAHQAREHFEAPQRLPGPTGETNELFLEGRGVIACISPWNFPLAIFTGQVAAALAAGNAVLAKPAESTPLVALRAAQLLRESGVPEDVLQVLPMRGAAFGEVALRDPRLGGVVFTGSTATAQAINRALAQRDGPILPLIAETGGQNAMVVDSTALLEQVVDDVLQSAFGSAGQRCSALRVLCLQEDVADRCVEMLRGAMDQLRVGDPSQASTDVGPLISPRAVAQLTDYLAQQRPFMRGAHLLALDARHRHGSFFAPCMFGIDDLEVLRGEQFGPVLHVLRFSAADRMSMLARLRGLGYALTFGVHSRLESAWREAFAATRAGNTYVNRGMTGAVVGVQPFGGTGLSGTGPKAGGPHYLPRLAVERTLTVNTTATGGNTALLQLQ